MATKDVQVSFFGIGGIDNNFQVFFSRESDISHYFMFAIVMLGCYLVWYCSRKCQVNHWSQHKEDCKVKLICKVLVWG